MANQPYMKATMDKLEFELYYPAIDAVVAALTWTQKAKTIAEFDMATRSYLRAIQALEIMGTARCQNYYFSGKDENYNEIEDLENETTEEYSYQDESIPAEETAPNGVVLVCRYTLDELGNRVLRKCADRAITREQIAEIRNDLNMLSLRLTGYEMDLAPTIVETDDDL